MPPHKFNAILERLGADSQMLLTMGPVSLPQSASPRGGWVLSTALPGNRVRWLQETEALCLRSGENRIWRLDQDPSEMETEDPRQDTAEDGVL